MRTDMSANSKHNEKIADISWAIFTICWVSSIIIIGYNIFQWLKTGVWVDIPFYSAFSWIGLDRSSITVEWQGVKKLIFWVIEAPLSLVLFISGAVLGFLFKTIFTMND